MILKNVKIRNFRCFTDIEVELCKTTVLIGENNAGKTSFLDAIKVCLSRSITKKGSGLEEYDHHLATEQSHFEDIQPLSIILDFVVEDDAPDELVQSLGDVIVLDEKDVRHVILRLESTFDDNLKDFISDWSFLDCSGSPLPSKAKKQYVMINFLLFTPIFYLTAFRDVAREFHSRSAFWAPFLRNPGLSEDKRAALQEQLEQLNTELISSHTSLQELKTHLGKIQEVVSRSGKDTVEIAALPGRITDLLSKTQVNMTTATGARIPLERHGSGTQSLAVIFLFKAFLETMVKEQYHEYSAPLLTLEEPEAHLHPCAVRSLWRALEDTPGQKLIATHSGDLLGRVPLESIRRFYRRNNDVKSSRLLPGSLSKIEERKINFHIRAHRGELLFAKCWLLGEGESEFWLFNEVAKLLDYDLDQLGIRIVSYQNSTGVGTLLKVANNFGIDWFLTSDGDNAGIDYIKTGSEHLNGRSKKKHIYGLKQPNIEVYLCESGYGGIYQKHISPQKKKNIIAKKGTREYWEQVVKAKDDTSKQDLILEVTALMESNRKDIPKELKWIIKASVELAEL